MQVTGNTFYYQKWVLTNRACSSRTGEFWPSVVAVRTSHVLLWPRYSVERYSYPHTASQNFGLQRKYLPPPQKKKTQENNQPFVPYQMNLVRFQNYKLSILRVTPCRNLLISFLFNFSYLHFLLFFTVFLELGKAPSKWGVFAKQWKCERCKLLFMINWYHLREKYLNNNG